MLHFQLFLHIKSSILPTTLYVDLNKISRLNDWNLFEGAWLDDNLVFGSRNSIDVCSCQIFIVIRCQAEVKTSIMSFENTRVVLCLPLDRGIGSFMFLLVFDHLLDFFQREVFQGSLFQII